MTQTVYLFDPHGVDAKCLISNESRAVPALGGRFRCIIPSAAPFYRKGAVVKHGARVLKEGVDFYFGHQYVRGTHQTAQMIYGSILILDETVTTPVTLSYQTLGGQYTVTDARITAYLANELKDPISSRWEDVLANDPFFPPVDIAYDIDNWTGEVALIDAVEHLGEAVAAQDPKNSDEYTLYDRWLKEQRKIVDDSLWAEHLANQNSTTTGTGTVTPGPEAPATGTDKVLVEEAVNYIGGWAINSSNFPGEWNNFNTSVGVVYGVSSLYDYMFSSDVVVYNPSVDPSSYTTELQGLAFDNIHEGWEASADIDIGGQSYIFEHDYGDRVNFMSTPDDIVNYMEFALKCNGFDMPDQSQYLAFRFEPQGLLSNGALSLWTHDGGLIEQVIYSDPAQVLPLGSKFDSMGTVSVKWGENDTEYYIQLSYTSEGTPYELRVPKSVVTDAVGEFGIGPYGIGAVNVPNIGAYNVTFKYLEADTSGTALKHFNLYELVRDEPNTALGFAHQPAGRLMYDDEVWFYADGVVDDADSWWMFNDDLDTAYHYTPLIWDDAVGKYVVDTALRSTNYNGLLSGYGFTNYQAKWELHYLRDPNSFDNDTLPEVDNVTGLMGIIIGRTPESTAVNETFSLIFEFTGAGDGTNESARIGVWRNYGVYGKAQRLDYIDIPEHGYRNNLTYWADVNLNSNGTLPTAVNISAGYTSLEEGRVQLYFYMFDGGIDTTLFDQAIHIGLTEYRGLNPTIRLVDLTSTPGGTGPVIEAPVVTEGTNPHGTLWYNANALKSDGIAKNANLFNGQTLDQLTAMVNAQQGVAASLGGLFPINVERVMTGNLILKDAMGSLWVNSSFNYLSAELSAGNQLLQSISSVILKADHNKNTVGAFASLESGANVLKVVSSGPDKDNNKLFFNDYQVFTTETLAANVPMNANATIDLHYVQQSPVTFSGKGSSSSPLKADIAIPMGSKTQSGRLVLTSDLTFDGVNLKAATPAAINSLRLQLANLVPNTVTVNGHRLNTDIIITETDLGVQNITNTSDMAKPVNAQYQALLEQYADDGHVHAWDVYDAPLATPTVAGITHFNNDLNDTITEAQTTAIESTAIENIYSEISNLESAAHSKMLNNGMDLVQYGDNSYLPIPAVGAYIASGPSSYSWSTGFLVEKSGKLVILRNGRDLVSEVVQYAYADIDGSGVISNYTPTITPYTPSALPAGLRVTKVIHNTETAMLVEVINSSNVRSLRYVRLNGTFDGTQHHVGAVSGVPYTADETTSMASRNSQRMVPFIVGSYAYVVAQVYNAAANGELTVSLYRAPLTPLDTNGTLTFTPVTLSGNDLYTLPQSGTVFPLVSYGVSQNAADKPLILVPAGASAEWAHFDIANTGFAINADGTKIRLIFGSEVYATTTTAGGAYWNCSAVIELATGVLTIDNGDVAPIVMDNSLASTNPMWMSDAGLEATFPIAKWDSEAFTTHVGEYRFGSRKHHATGTYIGTYTVSDSELSMFDSFALRARTATVANAVLVDGKYGGPSHSTMSSVAINRDTIYGINRLDGSKWARKYTTTGSIPYTTALEGFYPNGVGYVPSDAELKSIRHGISYLQSTDTTAPVGGVVFSTNHLVSDATYHGIAASITTTELERIRALIQTNLAVTPFDSYVMLYVPANPAHPVVAMFHWLDTPVNSLYTRRVAIYPVTLNARTGVVTATALGLRIATYMISADAKGYTRTDNNFNSSAIVKLSNGNLFYICNAAHRTDYTSWSGYESFTMMYNTVNMTWSDISNAQHDSNWNVKGWLAVPKYGACLLQPDASTTAVIATQFGWNEADITNEVEYGDRVIHSSQVLSGSVIYFTESETYVCNGMSVTIPAATLDLATLFPGQWINNRFYIYVVTTPGAGVFATYGYVVKTSLEADTTDQTYIGYCTTDATKVTNVVVNRVTKLGYFRELLDHINDPNAHGLTALTKADIGLPLVVNKSPRYELKTGLFGEVFSSWHRFSHGVTPVASIDWTQPAVPAELDAWSYSSADDTVKSTQNTGSYVGFVSNESVADYTFDTVVGVKATSTDIDDDIIGLVIGYVEIDGKEHTLSVLRMPKAIQVSDFGYVAGYQFAVYYDFHLPDQKPVALVDTIATDTNTGIWRGRYARIRVNRTGNTYVVKSTAITTSNWSAAVDADFIYSMTFTLDDLPELAKFKGSTRYGYSALSQIDASFINYQRPDEDGKNYYATALEAIRASYFADNMAIISGVVANGGVIPLPGGLTAGQCRVFLMPDKSVLGGGVNLGIKGLNLSHDPNTLVVTSTVTRTNGITYGMQAAYIIVGLPSFKLFK